MTDGKRDIAGRLSGHRCRTCSAKGRAWSPKARSSPAARSRPTPCSPSTTRTTCRKEVADALKKQGHWKEGDDGSNEMIAETRPLRAGAGAGAGADPVGRADRRRAQRDDRADGRRRRRRRWRSSRFVARRLRGADRVLRHVRFLGRQRVREFAFGDAADLQDHQRLGQPRRLDAAVGADPGAVRRAGRGVRRQPAGDAARPTCWRCRPGSPRRSISSSWSPRTRSCASPRRRSRAATSIRSCRTSASPSIRRCSISAMSASRSRSPSPSRR